MTENGQETSARSYRIYLLFMIAACGGACLWSEKLLCGMSPSS